MNKEKKLSWTGIIIRTFKKTVDKRKPIHIFHIGSAFLRIFAICAVIAAAIIGWTIHKNRQFEVAFYQTSSIKIEDKLRVIQLSDLHNSIFGRENDVLTERIRKLEPDLIVMSGDMIEESDVSMSVVLNLCQELKEVAPICYIYGNNEIAKLVSKRISDEELDSIFFDEDGSAVEHPQKDDDLSLMLEAMGVYVLWNESVAIPVGDRIVDVYGIFTSKPEIFWRYGTESYDHFMNYDGRQNFKLMVAHEPYVFETYKGEWADLILCGHTHGGEIRLPYIGAVYGKEKGWFPELLQNKEVYISGGYQIDNMPLIVSNGLVNNDWLRINNPPQLVVVDINRY